MSPTTTTNSVPAPTPKPTLEIIQAYFLQIIPPGDSKQKKYTRLLKFNFRWGLFKTKLQNSPKNLPPSFQHLQLRIWAQNQKSTCSILFTSSNSFQNGMTWPRSIKNRKVITFQVKGLGAGQGLPHGDWAGVIPTQKLPGTNLANPENFISIDPTVQKLINILQIRGSHQEPDPWVPWGGGAQIKNNICVLKFNFRRGLFYKELSISQKNCPLGIPTLVTR